LCGALRLTGNGHTCNTIEDSSAAKKWPDSKLPLIGLSNVLYQFGDYVNAEKFLLQALKLSPNDGDILNNLAYTYAQQHCYKQALSALEKALGLQPENKGYLSSKREIYSWQEDRKNEYCKGAQ